MFSPHLPLPQMSSTIQNVLHDLNAQHTIGIARRDNLFHDGLKHNTAVGLISGIISSRDWHDPFIASRQSDSKPTYCHKDVTSADLKVAVDPFTVSGNPIRKIPAQDPGHASQPRLVRGVMLNCMGEFVVGNEEEYSAVDIPFDNVILKNITTSDMTRLLGVKLLMRKWHTNIDWEWPGEAAGYGISDNTNATTISVCADPADSNWGETPMEWLGAVGNVVVMRADQKPITPFQVEVLCRYCRSRKLLMERANTLVPRARLDRWAGARTTLRERRNQNIFDPDYFRDYFYAYQAQMAEIRGIENWVNEVAPCDE